MIAQILVFFRAKKEKICDSFRKNCATVLRMETLSKFYLKHSEEISFVSKNIIFNDAVIIDLWFFYGEQNKSRWEGGGQKKIKKVSIFFQKRSF